VSRATWCRLAAAGLVVLLVAGCPGGTGNESSRQPDASSSPSLAEAPPAQQPPLLDAPKVNAAVGKLDGIMRDTMARTGVPGIAVGVVYQDKVIYLNGFGDRRVGTPDKVGPDTVFQLASVSKPLASTVVAGVVGQKTVGWQDPVIRYDPGFALKDPWVTGHVTIADLFSHRSGLPDHAGDLLEDLGFDRDYVLGHLRYEPLAPFRASYAYTNFGLTEAATAVARARGKQWADLSAEMLYKPLGMDATSSRFADYQKAADRAVTHVKVDGTWQAKYVREPDAQSPAGGASSTVRDMTRWIRLQLGNGMVDGRRVIDADSLVYTHLPQIVDAPPRAPAGRAEFYGLGWNVSYDAYGRLRLSHSGGFAAGAATIVTMLPSEQLGIVVLTNGEPVGAAEAIAYTFLDVAQQGHPTVAWLDLVGGIFAQQEQAGRSKTDYAKPPANAAAARPDSAYLGRYTNSFYGPLTVSATGGGLTMTLGPKNMRLRLAHYDGDTFSYQTLGENAVGLSGVMFTVGSGGRASKVRVEALDADGLGTFSSSGA
jgi:CubicO group peptidase (beta-lactamase class C family)